MASVPVAGAVIAAPSIVGAAAPLTLRMATPFNTDPKLSPAKVFYDKFTADLAKNCGDAIRINFYPDSQLGSDADLINQLKYGSVDIMMAGFAIWATVIPEVGALDLGYMMQDFAHFGRALDGAVGKTIEASLQSRGGVRVLGWSHSFGARNVLTRKPVKGPADLQDMKIRSLPSPPVVATVRAMGAMPVPMPIGEAYVSLQTGLVDGIEHDAPTVLASKFFEPVKNYCLTGHTFQAIPPLLSMRTWDKIPKELREGFQAAATAGVLYERQMALEIEKDALTELQSRGVTVTPGDRAAFEARVRPIWDEYAAKIPASKALIDGITAVRA